MATINVDLHGLYWNKAVWVISEANDGTVNCKCCHSPIKPRVRFVIKRRLVSDLEICSVNLPGQSTVWDLQKVWVVGDEHERGLPEVVKLADIFDTASLARQEVQERQTKLDAEYAALENQCPEKE